MHPLLVAGAAFLHADVAAAGGCVATDGQLAKSETATPTCNDVKLCPQSTQHTKFRNDRALRPVPQF